MFCNVCGAELKDTDKFCEICGSKVESDNSADSQNSEGEIQVTGTSEESNVHNVQLSIGTIIRGRYKVIDIIGRGGFCYTYKALDTVLGVEIAVKEYFPKSVAKRHSGEVVTVSTESDKESFLKF